MSRFRFMRILADLVRSVMLNWRVGLVIVTLLPLLGAIRGIFKPQSAVSPLFWGVLILIGIHLLPRYPTRRLTMAIPLFLAGFLAVHAAVGLMVQQNIWWPNSSLSTLIKHLVNTPTDRPTVLLVGSSYSHMGLDLERMEREFEKRGHPVRVARIAMGGMSHMERLALLRLYLAHHSPPAVALFEISSYYDRLPLLQFTENLYSDRMISMMDPSITPLMLREAWLENDLTSPARFKLIGQMLHHLLLNTLRAGQLPHMARFNNIPDYTNSAQTQSNPMDPAEVEQGLDKVVEAIQRERGQRRPDIPTDSARRVFAADFAVLGNYGVTRFGFYAMPTTVDAEAAYAQNFCAFMSPNYPCLTPDDPALIKTLRSPKYWYDKYHLYNEGQQVISPWLVEHLLEKGMVP